MENRSKPAIELDSTLDLDIYGSVEAQVAYLKAVEESLDAIERALPDRRPRTL